MKSKNTKTVQILTFVLMFFSTSVTRAQAAPGDLDLSFGNGGRVTSAGFFGRTVAIQSDGKIVAVGNGLERYNTDGSLDNRFGTGGRVVPHSSVVPGCFDPRYGDPCQFSPVSAAAVAIQTDGKIIAAGNGIISVDEGMYDTWVFALTRYNTDGTLDASFGTAGRVITYGSGAEGGPHAVAIQPDGKIVAAGYKRVTSWDFLTARYNTNGTLDASFGSGGLVTTSFGGIADEANDVAIQSDGKIVVAGQNRMGIFQGPLIFNFALARYNIDGSLDTSFGAGGKVVTPFGYNFGAEAIAIQSDGKMVAVGTSGIDYTYHTFALARYDTNGSLDSSFGKGGKVMTPFGSVNGSGVSDVVIQSDGKIIAVGGASDGTNSGVALARYNPDSSLDTSFGTGGKVITPSLTGAVDAAIQPDGKIIAVTQPERFVTGSEYALFRYQASASSLTVTNIEELYSAINNPQNAGMLIIVAPGVYILSVNDPSGAARPNSGRLELQENMSLQGVAGDRGAVVIDAINLPRSSFDNAPPITLTGAIRMGRGTNSIEWLTARNAVNGNAKFGTDLASTATNIRVAHVASSNSQRGLDVRNFGAAMAGRVINAAIIDNDFYNNRIGLNGESIRIASNNGAHGGIINATLAYNRGYDNYLGLIVDNNQSNDAVTTVFSYGDRFFENGVGMVILGGLSQGVNVANGNTISFTARGCRIENNNGFNNFDFGGLVIVGGENTSFPNGTSNNTVNVELRGCRFGNNQVHDLAAFGARSNPETVGTPGTNNVVNIYLRGITPTFRVESFIDSIPVSPGSNNRVLRQ